MSKLIKIGVGVAVAVALLSTPPAHADDQSYIDELKARGALVFPWQEKQWISAGHRMCNELRSGVPRPDVAAEVTQTDPAMFMDARTGTSRRRRTVRCRPTVSSTYRTASGQ